MTCIGLFDIGQPLLTYCMETFVRSHSWYVFGDIDCHVTCLADIDCHVLGLVLSSWTVGQSLLVDFANCEVLHSTLKVYVMKVCQVLLVEFSFTEHTCFESVCHENLFGDIDCHVTCMETFTAV